MTARHFLAVLICAALVAILAIVLSIEPSYGQQPGYQPQQYQVLYAPTRPMFRTPVRTGLWYAFCAPRARPWVYRPVVVPYPAQPTLATPYR